MYSIRKFQSIALEPRRNTVLQLYVSPMGYLIVSLECLENHHDWLE